MVRLAAGAAVCVLLASAPARAQGRQAGDAFIAARAGMNLVGNTYRVRQSRAVPGAGVSGGLFLSPSWAAEIEVWGRSSNPDCCAGRERLYSLSAARFYEPVGLQPYLAGGLALLRSQGETHVQVQVAVGVRLPVASRMAVDIDLRGNGGGSTMIVRPAVAAVYFFR